MTTTTLPAQPNDESRLPDLSGIPEQAQQVLELVALGHTLEQIAKLTKTTKQNVSKLALKYDPEGRYRALSRAEILELRAKNYERLSDRALLEVTDQKLKATSAAQLTTMAAICTDKAHVLNEQASAVPQDNRSPTEILVAIRARLDK